MGKDFELNAIGNNQKVIQIYGKVNGFAVKQIGGFYSYSFRFFDKEKRLIKISNGNNKAITSIAKLQEKINKEYCAINS